MSSSSLYADIDGSLYPDLLSRMEQYANEHHMEIFIFMLPKSELKSTSYSHDKCFMIMSAGYRIALVNGGCTLNEYEDYCYDVKDIISYLFSKYEYRSELGRFDKWSKNLIRENVQVSDIDDLGSFWESLKVYQKIDVKNTELLITLCTGSVNDIDRVKKDVPTTLLDQVKQKIQAFDADQTRFIYQELDQKQVVIQGLSGTGKTELLLHKLKELYQKPEKYKIFVTCHNKILADTLHDRIPLFFNFMKVVHQIEWNKRLWCTNAWGNQVNGNSGLYSYICDFYGITFYPYKSVASFESACGLAIKEIKQKYHGESIPPALDYIIVDECQDFKHDFFSLCQLVVSKKVYIAGDIFQSIYAESVSKSYSADFFLTKCYRTDSRTLMFAQALGLGLFENKRLRWLSQADWEACGYSYIRNEQENKIVLKREPVRRFLDVSEDYKSLILHPYKDDAALFHALISSIKSIINDNPTATINDFCIILLDSDQSIYKMANSLEAYLMQHLGWEVNKAYESKRKIQDTLLISNRNNVKGLEYPFVICISKKITSDYTYRNAIYTMLTRSFLQTILFLPISGSGIKTTILEGYNEIMTQRRMSISIPSEDERKEIETRFQAAKRRKPIADIIKSEIAKMGLPKLDQDRLFQAAIGLAWSDLSDEEISNNLNTLKQLL